MLKQIKSTKEVKKILKLYSLKSSLIYKFSPQETGEQDTHEWWMKLLKFNPENTWKTQFGKNKLNLRKKKIKHFKGP